MRAVIYADSKAGTMPYLSAIQTEKTSTRPLCPAKAKRAVEQAIHKPLETDRHLVELPAELRRDAIDHLAAYYRLANRRILAPLRSMLEEVENGDRKVMVGRQQPRVPGDNPM